MYPECNDIIFTLYGTPH